MDNIIDNLTKMVAIKFAEWKYKEGYISMYADKWCNKNYIRIDTKLHTIDELYDMFLESERERLKKENANENDKA